VSRPRLAACALLLPLLGCGRSCGARNDADAGPPPAPPPSALLPAPKAWQLEPQRGRLSLALPSSCRPRAPTLEADVPKLSRFTTDPRSLGQLIVGEATGTPAQLVAAAALTVDGAGVMRDPVSVPWTSAAQQPRLARSASGEWLGALAASAGAGASTVWLWRGLRAGAPTAGPDHVGDGDGFEPVDLACGNDRCALLTTRMSRVAAPGAELRVGSPSQPVSSWSRVELAPSRPGVDTQPIGICAVDPAPAAALIEGDQAVLVRVEANSPRELARLAAPHGLVDAVVDPPLALVYSAEVGEDGCAPAGGNLHVVRPNAETVELRSPAPPMVAAMRRLDRGVLVTWISPLGCGMQRRVVFAAVLSPDGALVGEVIPVGDATSFAVATSGAHVDLWIQNESNAAWMRLECAAP
jgi:hypothetical protein